MWRQIALPVIVVAVSWLAVSGSTNFYLQWLDASYQRVFDENVASMHAASFIQQETWRLHAEWNSRLDRISDWTDRLRSYDAQVQRELETINHTGTEEEKSVSMTISEMKKQYRDLLEASRTSGARPDPTAKARDDLFSLAVEISENSDHIREINSALMDTTNARRARITQGVLWARWIAITLVPALGIALGWWTATRLQRTVARIQVTLHDPYLDAPDNLGTVQVRGGNELASIHKQIEVVVDRLRRSGEELQAARQEVLRSERLAAIGGLAAGVAHELRNPLTSVKLLLQHAAGRGGDATVAAPKIGLILDEIERMETTIQGLLDFSRPAQPQRKLHHVRDTLERALHLVAGRAEKQHVNTKLDLGQSSLLVDGDPQQLHQVFVNLLINAIEAMPSGGWLSVSVTSDALKGEVTVEISDTGDGIPPELMPRLFEPFATGKERGTGLGLAVSRRILQEHEGTIAVRPRHPRGTIFEVTLPAVVTEAAEAMSVV